MCECEEGMGVRECEEVCVRGYVCEGVYLCKTVHVSVYAHV